MHNLDTRPVVPGQEHTCAFSLEQIRPVVAQDFAWFDRNPGRNLRLRLAEPAEVQHAKRSGGKVSPGMRAAILAVQVAPGRFVRVPVTMRKGADPARLGDAECFALLNQLLIGNEQLERTIVDALFYARRAA